jgi:hypothetical protein
MYRYHCVQQGDDEYRRQHPDLIIRENVDINEGITDAQAFKILDAA